MSAAKVLGQGLPYLLASQLATRTLTFALGTLLARNLSPDDLALTTVHFHLVTTTALFLSREGIRRGCLRAAEGDAAAVLRLGAWAPLCGVPVVLATCFAAVHGLAAGGDAAGGGGGDDVGDGGLAAAQYRRAVWLHGLAALLELLSEPLYNLFQYMDLYRARMVIEVCSLTLRSVVTFVAVVRLSAPPALAFGVAQCAYALCVCGGYAAWAWRAQVAIPLAGGGGGGGGDATAVAAARRELRRAALGFGAQAFTKHVLAEGEKVVMVLSSDSLHSQGVYGLVSNLGSLAVRCILQPFEEAAFILFSKLRSRSRRPAELGPAFALVAKAALVLGLTVVAFGPPYSYVLLRLLYGQRWSATEAPEVLGYYCVYVGSLALNGITEAFSHAVMTPPQLQRSNVAMLVLSALAIGGNVYGVRRAAAQGLIVANTLHMCLRVAYSVFVTRDQLLVRSGQGQTALAAALPGMPLWLSLGTIGIVLRISEAVAHTGESFLVSGARHILVGLGSLAILLAVIWYTEASFCRQMLQQLRPKRD
eukprot:scaffold2261_cov405-Prasinococcus_capsulatus_cf.AAC.24